MKDTYILVYFHEDQTYCVCNKNKTSILDGSLCIYFGTGRTKSPYKARILMEHGSRILLENLLGKLLTSVIIVLNKLPARNVPGSSYSNASPECREVVLTQSITSGIQSLDHQDYTNSNLSVFNDACTNLLESPTPCEISSPSSQKLNDDLVPLLNENVPEIEILYKDQMSSNCQDFIPINEIPELLSSPSIIQVSYPQQKSNISSTCIDSVVSKNIIEAQTMMDDELMNNESILDDNESFVFGTALPSSSHESDVSDQGLDHVRCQLFSEDNGYESEGADSDYIPSNNSEDSASTFSGDSRDISTLNCTATECAPLPISPILLRSVVDSVESIPPTPIPYGEVNITNVPNSSSISKKYFCTFCKKLVSKIARHLEMVHKNEDCVKAFSVLPKCNPERRKLINIIRGTGSFEYNTNINYNNGDLKVCRRPQSKKNRKPTDYECCPKCRDYFSKITFKRHCDKCLQNLAKNDRSVTIMGKRCRASIHSKASNVLKNFVFPPLREDDVVRSIRYDEFVILFANLLCEQYRSPHNYKMIRSQIRLIGRFLLIMRRLEPSIKSVVDCFQPKHFEKALAAIDEIAELDAESNLYNKPSVALNVGTILRKLANFYISECIKKEDRVAKKQTKDFISLMNVNFNPKVSQTAFESQLQLSRKKKIEIPSMEDIKLLNKYLNQNLKTYYEQLTKKFEYTTWKQLASFTLLSLIFFNRRRVGESERLKIIDFDNYQSVDENSDKEIFNSLSEDGKRAAQSFVRVVVRGKLGRTVAILLNKLYFKCIELVLEYRETAGVLSSNPYVFGLPGRADAPPKHLQACALMRVHSVQCKALKPHLLRGTILRKHIATQSVLLNLTDNEVSDLANYLGHADKIHKSHYRLPIVPREIAQISRLLEKAQGNDPEGEETDEDENELLTTQSGLKLGQKRMLTVTQQNEENTIGIKRNKCQTPENVTQRSPSRVTSTIYSCPQSTRQHVSKMVEEIRRTPWSSVERKVATDFFRRHLNLGKNPKLSECTTAIKENPDLRNRSPQQIKSWINNQILLTTRTYNENSGKTRWTTPEKDILQIEFSDNYRNQYLPSISKCEEVIKKYSVLQGRQPIVLKAKINNDIQKMQRDRKNSEKLKRDMKKISY